MNERVVTRRTLLTTAAAGAVGTLAGCLGGSEDEEVPAPISLTGGQACDQCNMVIDKHPGPVAQTYYLDDPPSQLEDREDGHGRFCSTWCLYRFVLDREQSGFEPVGSYATDYSGVDYELDQDAGVTIIDPAPPHLEAETFERVSELVFVVDSDVEGAMGASLIGFSDEENASAFADEYGGDILEDDDISLVLITAMGS
jgi:nitrous oxide reductase accessory protein NosL